MKSRTAIVILAAFVAALVVTTPVVAQDIVVTAADPAAAAQGTTGLSVRITGKGFKRGANARFLRTGTSDPDGIIVNSTTYVSSGELIANIDVSLQTSLDKFDIEVSAAGRTGKGTEMFGVTPGGAGVGCVLPSSSPQFELVGTLNSLSGTAPRFQGSLGVHVAMRPATVPVAGSPRDVLVAAVGSAESRAIEVFVLDAQSGAELQHASVVPDASLVLGPRSMAAGDVNGDGIPDFALADPFANAAFVLVGAITDGTLSYSARRVLRPTGTSAAFGWELALGDLDGFVGDELAVTLDGGGSGKNATGGSVHLYAFGVNGTPTYLRSVTLAGIKADDSFGRGLAIGDVTGGPGNDLIVSAVGRDDGASNAGAVYVFVGPALSTAVALRALPVRANDAFGRKVAVGNVDGGFDDVIVSTGWAGPDVRADVFPGLVGLGSTPLSAWTMRPAAGLSAGWTTTAPSAGDIDGDGLADVVIGAPNATTSSQCTSPGVAYVFMSTPSGAPVRHMLWAPTPDPDFAGFGWSVAASDGSRVILVTEHQRNLGAVSSAGQVYIFKYLQ